MDYQQPTISSLQKVKASHDKVPDSLWPLVAGTEDGTTSSSFAATQREPFAYVTSGFIDGSTSYSFAGNPSQPFDQPVAVPSYDTSSSPFTATLHERFEPLNPHFLTSSKASSAASRTANTKPQPQYPSSESSLRRRPSPSMSAFSFEQPLQQSRYYAQALTAEDKLALVQGEKNHNLQEWSAKNLVTHHEARKDLIPRVMPKVEKTNALAGIEHDKQHSQRALFKVTEKVCKVFSLPRIKVTVDTAKDGEPTYAQLGQVSQSTYDLRTSIPSPTELAPQPAPALLFEGREGEPRHYHASHTRAASSGDYFSKPPGPRTGTYNARRISHLASTSGPSSSSDSSSRIRSPLAQEVQFRANPKTTFDSFLAPHKSGKGEVLRDSQDAKKINTLDASPSPSPKAKAKIRRLTKMPSMPLLRKRGSRSESG